MVFDKALPALSTLTLDIIYTGFLNNQMAGFYRSSYTNIHGESKIMASTQFEALDARRCFPCWDEPARKAIFGVTLIVDAPLTCFSNMPEKSCHSAGSKKTVSFLDSPKMSTYLLAFCVGEFDYVQAHTDHGVLIKVYTPPGKASAGLFALDCAVRSLDRYDDFFGVPYPLPKLDMVAIGEFAAGAMENWGLVTYREVDLLIDPITASNSQKQRVLTVVTHELAHQWFGNLVTMAWWDDLWLNEGFASWAENWAANEIYPDFFMWDQFTTGHLSAALRLDALKSSHPIQVPICHAEEVEQIFDAVSYCKGGSVVRMIKAVLGMKAFQEGLGNYMAKHAYGNTETYDLWNAWEATSGMPVGEMMTSWTEQMGFPLLKVTKETWEATSVTLELEQVWFLSDGSEMTPEEASKKWTIPIMTCTSDGTQQDMVLMRERTASITIPLPSAEGWVKLNAGQEVPMRVLNTPEMIRRLSDAIKSQALPPCDRAGLLSDGYALVKAGHMRPESLLMLLASYDTEESYIVWEGLASVLGGLDTVLSDDEKMAANFLAFAKKVVIGLVPRVGWEAKPDDGHLTVMLRSIMISLLGAFCSDEESVANEAKVRFAKFLEDAGDVKSLPSDMRSSVFKIILKNGGETEYNQVLSYFTTASDQAERKHVLASLGAAKDPTLKLRTMDWTTSGAVKLQDFFYAMGSVGNSSRQGREISWKYYQNNFDRIKGMIAKASPSLMDACIVSCAGGFCSNAKADEIDAFFVKNPCPSNARKIAQTTENMRANAKFLEMLQASDLSKDDFWATL
jgi:puromycin-sensitive aminopeptidase